MRSTCTHWRAHFRVDLDPVIPHASVHYLSSRLRHDHVGFLDWHMTIDALVGYFVSHLFRHPAALPLVTSKAFERIRLQRLSGGVDVVAS